MNACPLVITGASGFIGRNLLSMLAGTSAQVCALVRGNAAGLPSASNIEIKKVSKYTDHIPAARSVLIHLGEPSHVVGLEKIGSRHADGMLSQAVSLLERGYHHMIYASSATVYGDGEDADLTPDSPVVIGRKLYADTKLEVEKVITDATGCVARITNVYGPGMSEINIFSDILFQLSKKGPLKIREATPVREYLWVKDLAKCLLAMANRPSAGIYNISSHEPVSCHDLARRVLDLAGQPERPIVAQYPLRRSILRLDIGKTMETFAWKPETSLSEGITLLLKDRHYG